MGPCQAYVRGILDSERDRNRLRQGVFPAEDSKPLAEFQSSKAAANSRRGAKERAKKESCKAI